MSYYSVCFKKNQIINGIKVILTNFRSSRELYDAIRPSKWRDPKEKFSYSQFNRYIKGEYPITRNNEEFFFQFLLNNLNLSVDLVQPNIDIDISTIPIQVDMSRLLSNPDKVNLLAFLVIEQNHLVGKFDAILTHSEAIPLAVAFSQILSIPWFAVNFRPPPVHPSRVSRHPYLVDQELVATAYFVTSQNLRNKRLLVISDYIRRGGFLRVLRRVVEDNNAEVHFLFAVLAIGSDYRRFYDELDGNMRVVYFI